MIAHDPAVRCPVCGHGKHRVVYDMAIPYDAVSIPGRIVRCQRCAMWWKIPAPGVRILEHYEEPYASGEMNDQYMLSRAARRFFRSALARIERPAGARPRLLDVGTGMGALLEEANALDFDAEGVDVSLPLVERARARGLRVHLGTASSIAPDGGFDVVTLLDVIEHVDDPRSVLTAIRRLLRPTGQLVVYTPNHRASLVLAARALHRIGVSFPVRAIFGGNHIDVFDDRSLPLLLRSTGFDVQRIVRSPYDPERAGLPLSPFAAAGIRALELVGTPFGRTFRLLVYARPGRP